MSTRYANVDAELLRLIADGCNTLMRLQWREYPKLRMPRDYRVLERRLQALRRAGRITYNGGVWCVTGRTHATCNDRP